MGLGDGHISKLTPYPPGGPGVRTPLDLWRYAGKGECSWSSPSLGMPFAEWAALHKEQKPKLMAERHSSMQSRYDFSDSAIAGITMSRGKPVMKGPVARLAKGVQSFDELAAMAPEEIKQNDLFPYLPLSHPLQTTAHMLFPEPWLKAHPEHRRIDGDPGLMQAIGPRGAQRQITNRMGDFNAILDFAPAPKLGPLMRLYPAQASQSELRGEKLFFGKAKCAECHVGPAFVDDYMHDLQVERFYRGRPEGPIKTFPLRGIKDSPPYLHDGRCPTLRDAVEFFNLVLQLQLGEAEKEDIVAFLLCL